MPRCWLSPFFFMSLLSSLLDYRSLKIAVKHSEWAWQRFMWIYESKVRNAQIPFQDPFEFYKCHEFISGYFCAMVLSISETKKSTETFHLFFVNKWNTERIFLESMLDIIFIGRYNIISINWKQLRVVIDRGSNQQK